MRDSTAYVAPGSAEVAFCPGKRAVSMMGDAIFALRVFRMYSAASPANPGAALARTRAARSVFRPTWAARFSGLGRCWKTDLTMDMLAPLKRRDGNAVSVRHRLLNLFHWKSEVFGVVHSREPGDALKVGELRRAPIRQA